MFKVKFTNGIILEFLSEKELIEYVSKNWSIQKFQVKIENNYIALTNKLGEKFAIIGRIS